MLHVATRPLLLLSVLALAVLPLAAQAQSPAERGQARGEQQLVRGQEGMADSVRRVERETRGGRVLSAERMQADGRNVNRIKAVDDRGRVRVYVHDPQRQRSQPQPPRGDDD